jgi:RHS repeat-associated protein
MKGKSEVPRRMTNESGTVVWSATYYPFGEMTAGSGNTHGYTGKEYDSEMELNYMCQRYYDPQIGRFTQLDLRDNPAASPYAYCANNPLKYTDPAGEAFDWKSTLMAGALGVYEGWKSGMRSYMFSDYDEWGNLIGLDYYDPYSANNPLLEMGTIPPAVYFGISWSSNMTGDANMINAFMKVVWALSIASPRCAWALQVYVGKDISFGTLPDNWALTTVYKTNGQVTGWKFSFGDHSDLGLLAHTVLHEASHVLDALDLIPPLRREWTEFWVKITDPFKNDIMPWYHSRADIWATRHIKSIGPLFRLGIYWPRWPIHPLDLGYDYIWFKNYGPGHQ